MPLRKPPASEIAQLIQDARQGSGDAANDLGRRYRTGDGVAKNLKRARYWYMLGAMRGHPAAQNNYGSMLYNGLGGKRDLSEAAKWYRRSAEQRQSVAQFNLGWCYLHGEGVNQDESEAAHWFSRSASDGYRLAIGQLGTLYWLGRGVERDLLRASELHTIAAYGGDAHSHQALRDCEPELVELALEGSRHAALTLCRMHDWGLGVEQNPARCWSWIKWARDVCYPIGNETDDEVQRVYRFFRHVYDEAVRKEGDGISAERRRKPEPPEKGSA